MTMMEKGAPASRPLRAALAGMALVVLVALLFPAKPCPAADALLPGARPDVGASGLPEMRPAMQQEMRPGPALAPAPATPQAPRPATARQQQAMLPARGAGPNLSLLPYLDYLLDESGSLDIEEAAAPDRAGAFAPLALEKLPRAEGVMWLRFTLAPLPAGERPQTLLLDMGASIPGTPMLYEPERNDLSGALEWRETSPAPRNVLILPEAGPEPLTCYIRLDGLPGLWFSPLVRTPADAATNWGSLARTGAMLALGVVMLLCLLRWLSENGQWRVWTALYVAVALAQALLGMPEAISQGAGLGRAAATLAPGIALMLLPHVGRHLMRTRERARGLDIQLLLLSLPGAALALLPLVPGWSWLDRWLDLWPVVTLIFVPTALGAWIMGLGGARRFLLGCLLPPIFVAAGVLGLDFGIPPNLLASAPLWGTALSALLIAGTGAPADMAPAQAREAASVRTEEGGIIALEHPLDDPNLRLVSGGSATPPASQAKAAGKGDAEGDDIPEGLAGERARAEAREGALRAPLDDLLREGAALEQCALPPAVRQSAAAMLAAARRMADVLSGPEASEAPSEGVEREEAATAFDLQRLLREAHGAVAPAAEYAGIGLAWYMPPHLGQLYRGDARTLGETLGLLLESAVRATRQGAVHLSARRVPESSDAGNILFTVTDTGTGAPPRDRSSLALARAWELAARHGGYVGMEYGPNGTTIAFSLHLEPLEDNPEEMPGESLPHVIVVADDQAGRRELARMVAELPCRLSEAANEHEALRRHEADPAVLLVAQGRYALPAAADMVTKFMEVAAGAGLSGCKVLAITADDSQWNLLADSGFTHALLEPVDAEALRQTVRDVIRNARRIRPQGQKTPEKAEERPREKESGEEAPAASEETPSPSGETAPVDTEAVGQTAGRQGDAQPEAQEASPARQAGPEPEAGSAAPDAAAEASAALPEAEEAPRPDNQEEGRASGEISGEEVEFLLAASVTDAAEATPAENAPGQEPAPASGAETPASQTPPETSAESLPEAPAAATAETPAPAPSGSPETAGDDPGGEPAIPGPEPAPMAPVANAPQQPEAPSFMEDVVAATPVAATESAATAVMPAADSVTERTPGPERPAAAPEAQPRSEDAPASRVSVYVSPSLSSPGEWVGEPMPIGTPLTRQERPEVRAREERPRQDTVPQAPPREDTSRRYAAAGGYTSPSVPVPGEWVGEPMPIPRKQSAPPREEAKPPTETAPAAAAPEAEDAGSLMDFIVGATRVEKSAPAAPEAPSRSEAAAQPSGGVTDFVERSVTLVTSAVSTAFGPAQRAEGPQEAAAPEKEMPAPEGASAGASVDPAIRALVARLDAAMAEASEAHAAGRGLGVAQAAAKIAGESESFGFRVLARMARCVERAGRAGDMNALRDLLPELAVSVERNRIALTQRK